MVGIMLIMDVQNSVSVLRIKLADKTIAKKRKSIWAQRLEFAPADWLSTV